MTATYFSYNNITFKKYGGAKLVYVQGEITNSSDRQYNTAAFRISVYDKTAIAWTGVIKIRNLRRGQTKPFELPMEGVEPGLLNKIAKHEICFESGY